VRVLIVDDEAPIRRLLQAWVEGEGVSASQASNAEDALAVIQSDGAPGVMLCDIRMPGKDGLWLAGQLRASHPETAVVMTTGVHEFDAAIHSLQAGVVDYLVKPFTRDRMVEALNRAIFAHKTRHALAVMDQELVQRRAQIADALAEIELNASTSLEAMLSMLGARDPGTLDHAHRVARLAVNLAMALQIGEPRLSDIERAALLHNLGRLALPDALLARPEDTLDAAERERFRAHPVHGHTMLKNVPFLAAAAEIVVAAHERYDGSGFPHGLRGDAIPVGARVIAVASAYEQLAPAPADALACARALDTLLTSRSHEFDPMVLGALKMLQPAAANAQA
jgi:response regulator RpfG family c-di-GMP phosphodiesterase